jgi:hypothetical protein
MHWVTQRAEPTRRKRPGVEVSAESESGARWNWGMPGTWEALLPPPEIVMGRSRKTVQVCREGCHQRQERTKGTRAVLPNEGNEVRREG